MPGRRIPTKFPMLPAGPLAEMLEARSVFDTAGNLVTNLGLTEKRIRDWREPGCKARFDSADRVLTNLGLAWWDVWTEENTEPQALVRVRYAFECYCEQATIRSCKCGAAEGYVPATGEQLEMVS